LSDHKSLVIEKLAEEETERKIKGETKKEKLMVILNFKFTVIFMISQLALKFMCISNYRRPKYYLSGKQSGNC